MQSQAGELARMGKGLQRQRISTDREIKFQRAWAEAELKGRSIAAQVQQLEGGISELASELAAAQAHERSWTEQYMQYSTLLHREVEHQRARMAEVELKERALAVQVHQVEGRIPELAAVQEKVDAWIENMEGDLAGLRAFVLRSYAVANGSSDSGGDDT